MDVLLHQNFRIKMAIASRITRVAVRFYVRSTAFMRIPSALWSWSHRSRLWYRSAPPVIARNCTPNEFCFKASAPSVRWFSVLLGSLRARRLPLENSQNSFNTGESERFLQDSRQLTLSKEKLVVSKNSPTNSMLLNSCKNSVFKSTF